MVMATAAVPVQEIAPELAIAMAITMVSILMATVLRIRIIRVMITEMMVAITTLTRIMTK